MAKQPGKKLVAAKVQIKSPSFTTRLKGFETLHQLGRDDLVLEYAVEETDMRVLEPVTKWFSPKPKTLVRHLATVMRGCFSDLWIRYDMARDNYLYAEDTLYEILSRKKQLTVYTIEAIGLGYLRSCGALLHKYLKGRMVNYKTARAVDGSRAVSGVRLPVTSDGSDEWGRESASVIQSALALARLDCDFDLGEVQRIIREIPAAMDGPTADATIGQLKWVLFDKGVTNDLEELLQYFQRSRCFGPDLAMSLLKKNRMDDLQKLAIRVVTYGSDGNICWTPRRGEKVEIVTEHIGVNFAKPEFCYWPVINWLENEKLFDSATWDRSMGGYREARKGDVDPPPWWQWISNEASR